MRRIAVLDAPSNLGLRPPTDTSVIQLNPARSLFTAPEPFRTATMPSPSAMLTVSPPAR